MRISPWLKSRLCLAALLAAWAGGYPRVAQAEPSGARSVPSTISAPAQRVLRGLLDGGGKAFVVPADADATAWKQLRDGFEKVFVPISSDIVARCGVTVRGARLGGVPVYDVRPKGYKHDDRVLVFMHGGGFTLLSARATLGSAALMARATGLRVVSLDYARAPEARWSTIQAQAVAVFKGLLQSGHTMKQIALYGDSAGGNLAVATVLNLRDQGLGMPVAVVLFSPWADLTNEGDTAATLVEADPTLSYTAFLRPSARAYADGVDLRDARVSPVYADFSGGFPPTLIQEGTRTILLSTSVRLYEKLDAAGAKPVMDMYEGMWHDFQGTPIPESDRAIRKAAAFLRARLR